MPNITDFLLGTASGQTFPVSGVWVRLQNNVSLATFVSTAVTDAVGTFTVLAVPPGQYTVATGPTNTGPFTSTTDTSYNVGADVNTAINPFIGGDPWFDAKNSTYSGGAKSDGVTDSAPAIQAALNAASAAGGGTVFIPPAGPSNVYVIGSRLIVPFGVKLRGGGRNSCWVQAISGTFPINTEMIRLGDLSGSIGVDTWVSDMHIDCNNIAGSIGVYSERINENSGAKRMSINNFMSRGVQIKQPASGGTPQHYTLDELEFGTSASTPAAAIALDIANTSLTTPFRRISRISIGGTTALTTAMKIDGCSGRIEQVHIEHMTTGILVGSVLACFGLTIADVDGLNNVTNLVSISNTGGQRSIMLYDISPAGATNAIVDNINTVTVTTDIGCYVIGNQAVIASDGGLLTRLGRLALLKDIRLATSAPAFVASFTPDPTSAEIVSMFLTGNVTVNNPTNLAAGHFLIFQWLQDGTGGRTIAYGASYHTSGAPAIVTTANTSTLDTFYSFDGASLRLVSRITGQT